MSGSAQLPLASVNTTPPPVTGQIVYVNSGGNLQAAINAAQPGDEIVLQAGATFTGPITLPNKTGSGWITITSSGAGALTPGARVDPSEASQMATILAPGSNVPALKTAAGAHNYYISGLNITTASSVTTTTDLVELGTVGSAQNTVAQEPYNIIIDRSYIHGSSTLDLRRAISLQSASTAIINSYISDVHAVGADSQAIAGWNGSGPYLIQNNFLEASGENVMFGGADPSIPNLIPSDITIQGNDFYKPLSWQGSQWSVKNLFELKLGNRVLVQNNTFENNWANAQNGYAILLRSTDQDGTAPWSVVSNVTFQQNTITNSPSGINLDSELGTAVGMSNININNNLLYNIGSGGGRLFQILGYQGVPIQNLSITNNTAIGTSGLGMAVMFDAATSSGAGSTDAVNGLVFSNNVLSSGQYGVFGSGKGTGNAALSAFAPGGVFTGNVIIGGTASAYSSYPGNYFPISVSFVSPSTGNYNLTTPSLYDGGAAGDQFINVAAPSATVTAISDSPSTGDLNAGKTVALTLSFGEAVTVAGGTPTLTLNDGGTATYASGSGTSALTFNTTVAAGQNAASLAATAVNLPTGVTITDGAGNAANLSLSGLTQSGPQIDAVTPAVTAISDSPSTGDLNAGKTVALTLSFGEAVTVAGGTPTLTLNDGGTATYASGSGTSALTFNTTVAAGQNAASLAATAVNLPTGVTITDGAGNAANLSLSGLTQSGPQVDTVTPAVTAISDSPSTGDLNAGKTVALTLSFGEAVTVAGGTPTLTLNDGGTATYASGSGTSALTFNTTVAAGQNAASLAATAVNLPTGVTITDGAGNAANLSLSGLTQSGPQIDAVTPAVTAISDSPSTGDLNAGKTVALTLSFGEAVTVAGGTPTLTLNDGGTATYASGSGTSALTFNTTVAAGQNAASLAATAVNLPTGVTITDGAGNAANLSLSGLTQSGPQVDTVAPAVTAISESPDTGDLNAGKSVAVTLSFSENVTVTGGTPTLTLNDGGTATYASGSGTNALTFNYTVAAGQNTPDLMVSTVNLNSASISDSAANAANLSLSGIAQSSPQIDTTSPGVASVTASPGSGTETVGNAITFTVNMSEAVTVAGGTPTLTLNDGGTATYASGSGANALTFTYTVASTDSSVSSLAITSVNVPSGVTITDGAGNTADMSGAIATFAGISVNRSVTVAGYLTNQAALDAGGNITIADTAANVSGSVDALNADTHVSSITLTDTGTPTLGLSIAQALGDTRALGTMTNPSYTIAVTDSAATLSANIDALNSDTHVSSLNLTDAGQPTLSMTVAQALNDTTALGEITSPYTITISDTAAHIQTLTPAQIATLQQTYVSQIAAIDASVSLKAGQAVALENQSISVSAPKGSLVTISDIAANLQAMTAAQLYGLAMIGANAVNSTNANVTFSAAQTSAILAAKLGLSAAGAYSVTEKFTSGAVISSSNQGSSGGALTLSTKANGLTVNVGASALSVTSGTETIPLTFHSSESITATSRTKDTFVFTPGFGNDTIIGFAATGSNHDTMQFNASMFSYLTPGMTQAQDLAAVISHATTSGGSTTISDSLGDKLTLSAIAVSSLQANPADFKFV